MKALKYALAAIAFFISFNIDLSAQCDAPTMLAQRYVTDNTVEAGWRSDTNAVYYNVDIRPFGTTTWTSDTTSRRRYTFTGLTACTHYEMRIQSVCSGSNSAWSPVTEVMTSACLGVPDKLTVQLSAASTGDKIYVRWVPTDYKTMQWGAKYGYTLTRTTLMQADTILGMGESYNTRKLINPFLRPIQDSTYWETKAETDDMAGVAAGALFGEEMVAQSVNNIELMDVVNMNKAEETKFGFGLFAADADFSLAQDMGLGYLDNSVVAGEQYLYTIQLNNVDSTTTARRGSAVIAPSDTIYLPPVIGFSGRGGDSIAYLTWDNSQTEDLFSSFVVERSDNNGSTFQPVSDKPIIYTSNAGDIPGQINFTDALPDNTNTYVFRVKGKSPFGLDGTLSDTIHVKGRPAPIPIAPGLTSAKEINIGTITLDWEFDASFNSEIQGFHIFRAPSRDSLFVPVTTSLLSPSTRTFIDNSPDPVNYYRIMVTDVNNHKIPSLAVLGQLTDDTPPNPPTGLSGAIDDSGLLTLTWVKSTSDDAVGYRVYTSNQLTGEFSQLTQTYLKDSVFYYEINLEALNEEIYYGVKAVDMHENYSDMSEVVTVGRPDIIPPSPPRITNVEATFDDISLEWELSGSGDVVRYKLERKIHEIPGWEEIMTFGADDALEAYRDERAEVGIWYEYRLLAYDEADNFGASETVRARAINSGLRPPIENFRGALLPGSVDGTPSINLNWEYPEEELREGLMGFTIYRGIDSSNMRTFKSISVDEAMDMATSMGGGSNMVDYGYIDNDMNFTIPVRSTYRIPSTYNPAAPGTIRPRNQSGGSGTPAIVFTNKQVNNPNIPQHLANQGISVDIYYQVIAVFKDGTMSPLSDFVAVSPF